jgi:hypothetical protein
MLKLKMAGIAAAAAFAVSAVPAAAVTPLVNYAQFFQLSNAKQFNFTVNGGTNMVWATNASALMIAQSFVKAPFSAGDVFVGVASLFASSSDAMVWNGVSWEQPGYTGTFSFTSGAINVLTMNFTGGVFTRTDGTTPTASLLAECPCGITWTSDVFDLTNPQDYAFAINALAGLAWTNADKLDPTFMGRDFVGNGVGTFAAVVPEPATWAMLISGFGLVGFAARRRRDSVTA